MGRATSMAPVMATPYGRRAGSDYDKQAPCYTVVENGVDLTPEGYSFGCVDRGVIGHAQQDSEGFFWFVPNANCVLSTTVIERIAKQLRKLNK